MISETIKHLVNLCIVVGGALAFRTLSGIVVWNVLEQTYQTRYYRMSAFTNLVMDFMTIFGAIVTYEKFIR